MWNLFWSFQFPLRISPTVNQNYLTVNLHYYAAILLGIWNFEDKQRYGVKSGQNKKAQKIFYWKNGSARKILVSSYFVMALRIWRNLPFATLGFSSIFFVFLVHSKMPIQMLFVCSLIIRRITYPAILALHSFGIKNSFNHCFLTSENKKNQIN